jgi:hypothetical protein
MLYYMGGSNDWRLRVLRLRISLIWMWALGDPFEAVTPIGYINLVPKGH